MMTFTDISGRKKDEATIRSAMADLERFAHLASHDLQHPLRKIAIHTGLLRQAVAESNADERERCLEIIHHAAQRGRHLVSDLLRYSKLGNGTLSRKTVRLDTMIGELIYDLLDTRPAGDAYVENFLPELNVSCDGALIAQVFQNLFDNALKYRKKGTPGEIRIYCEEKSTGISIHVADRGIGFDMKQKEAVFQPFSRLANAQQAEGTGIGLSLVRSIIDKHQWTIDARSEVGQGSDFFILIPQSDVLANHTLESRAA